MRIVVIGLALMLAGILALFGMVAGIVVPGLVLAFGAYAMTFVGLLLGVFGLAQWAQRRLRARRPQR